ncbi:uncharacterized protein GGS25DRAFT_520142 [Hypoxylon fragiforme]|uniref:uncharacterized protein n=1 Tax=Hypoxylon fragiforme TaxID=63214 RepID=UPI0020C71844|nr:uncharacterized protein GGS25DRAFT_520142 [Hypoxylon fragiforme]KAI2609351.1 hypothetical protein GGS25DRAFT_520142 [Hypoxylon fragiforme]
MQQLLERIPPSANKDYCQKMAVEGLGGIGKTQIALEVAYYVHDQYPDCSVFFWVPAVNAVSFNDAYHQIGDRLLLQGLDDGKENINKMIQSALNRESTGNLLLMIDDADDLKLLFNDNAPSGYIPFSQKGSVYLYYHPES